jgi:hypothetical protein
MIQRIALIALNALVLGLVWTAIALLVPYHPIHHILNWLP